MNIEERFDIADVLAGVLNGTVPHKHASAFLRGYREVQRRAYALDNVPEDRAIVTLATLDKLAANEQRWGKRVYPSFEPLLESCADTTPAILAGQHEIVNPTRARKLTDAQAADGSLSWMTILVEEVSKTTEKMTRTGLRDQLIDVAGVALAWAEQLTDVMTELTALGGNQEKGDDVEAKTH